MKEKLNSVEELILRYFDELNQRGYKKGSQCVFKRICRSILQWCSDNGISDFDESTGNSYCDEKIGGHLCNSAETLHYKKTLRVARMLVSLNVNGDFEFRSPAVEFKFKTNIGEYFEEYLAYCRYVKGLSKPTIEQRRLTVFRFDSFLWENNMTPADIDTASFENFFSSKYCTKKSRRHYKSVLREFYQFLYEKKEFNKDFSTLILKEPKVQFGADVVTTYTIDEIKQMISTVSRSSAKGKRDYLVLLLAAEYGWRASDITGFRVDQIDWNKNIITIIQFKTGVPATFPLLSSVGNAIIDYIKFGRPKGGDDVIIVNHENTHKGQKLKSPTIHSIVSKAFRQANINNWKTKQHGPHALRHSLATNMLKQNVSIPIISTVLGHRSTETTKAYIEVDIPKLRLCGLPIPPINSPYFQAGKEVAV